MYDNGSSGDTSEEFMFDTNSSTGAHVSIKLATPSSNQDDQNLGVWSNSSR